MHNEPVAWMMQYRDRHEFRWTKPEHLYDALACEPLYTHPVKENYMNEVLNNTLNIEKNHNEKAYKELYEVCVKQQAEIEVLKAHPADLTDEEIIELFEHPDDFNCIDFARAILRKAQQ